MLFRVVLSVLCLRMALAISIDDVVCPGDVTGWVRVAIPGSDPVAYSTCVAGLCDPFDPNGPRVDIYECGRTGQVIQEILTSATPVMPSACPNSVFLAAQCTPYVCQQFASETGCGDTIADDKDGGDQPQGDPTGGDPHFVQEVDGTTLCYGLIGIDGGTYLLLEDGATSSSVEGTVIVTAGGPFIYSSVTIHAPTKDVTMSWTHGGVVYSEDVKVGGTGQVVVTELQEGQLVRVDVGTDTDAIYAVFCQRRGVFLDCWITPTDLLTECNGGILCDFPIAVSSVTDGVGGKDVACTSGNTVKARPSSRLGTACYLLRGNALESCMGPISNYLVVNNPV